MATKMKKPAPVNAKGGTNLNGGKKGVMKMGGMKTMGKKKG